MGLKKDYSTVDHMFTLMAMIQKQFALHRKLYVAFIDFEKAFDSISRKLLWPILLKNGIDVVPRLQTISTVPVV